jgi:hypothetical protein
MKRHASADELADLAAGVLRPRKAGRISSHLSGCVYCTGVSNQLADVSSLLASVPVAPMPASLSSRIEGAIAAESAQRLASEPATEAGRRDLPARGRPPRRSGPDWRIPLLSGQASRLVAAAGALVIIGGGGYEIAAHIGAASVTSASSPSAGSAVVPPGQRLSSGPSITYQQGTHIKSVRTVSSATNFTASTLGQKAIAALRANHVTTAPANSGAASPTSHATAKAAGSIYSTNGPGPHSSANLSTAQSRRLTGCVDRIAAGQRVLLVELAYFDSRPATIIVIASAKPGAADVWAVRSSCTATNTEVLSHVRVAPT